MERLSLMAELLMVNLLVLVLNSQLMTTQNPYLLELDPASNL
jgi:hypothetical protein